MILLLGYYTRTHGLTVHMRGSHVTVSGEEALLQAVLELGITNRSVSRKRGLYDLNTKQLWLFENDIHFH